MISKVQTSSGKRWDLISYLMVLATSAIAFTNATLTTNSPTDSATKLPLEDTTVVSISPANRYGNYHLPPYLEKEFVWEVFALANKLGTRGEWLLAVMAFESGGTFSPSKQNKRSRATGLIQFIPDTAISLGTSTTELSRMNRRQQLQFVAKYLSSYRGKMKSLENTYMAVLNPAAIGLKNDGVLWKIGSIEYEQNSGLDLNKDGAISKGEATSKVRKYLPSAVSLKRYGK